jgi:CheY-like chemotaxis protein
MPHEPPLIVLVDDDPDFLVTHQYLLESNGYRVLGFTDPQEALKKMREQKPALVITDLMMKDLDSGFAFARLLKQDAALRDVPVIILTGISGRLGFDLRPESRRDLTAMSADAFLEKPIAPASLLAKVEELLRRRAQGGGPQ